VDAQSERRCYVLDHVVAGAISAAQAAGLLECSIRQVRRLLVRYQAGGESGLVHSNRGRTPANRSDPELVDRVVGLATTKYVGVNRTHLSELLQENEDIRVQDRTLRRILDAAGIPPVRTRRPPPHRSRRERMPKEGLLLQVDGSRHDWLEGRGPTLSLVGGIDDATGKVTAAVFREQEDSAGYFTVLAQTSRRFGLPVSLYSDRHGIFHRDAKTKPSIAVQLSGRRPKTQVGRALEQARIGWIPANSPQAKGRIERLWGTFQDRLVSELRLAGAATIDQANTVLARYLPRHNARFAVPAVDEMPAWRDWPEGLEAKGVFCFHYPRRVAKDSTVSWGEQDLALPKRKDARSWAGMAVTVQERLDASLWVEHAGECYRLKLAPPTAALLRARRNCHNGEDMTDVQVGPEMPAPVKTPPPRSTPHRPAPDHPWRAKLHTRR